ncbi:MAG: aldo/keto reductase [Verrucomicrobia bacterium]|nr:aldo/keto reductase [Verrucomicrobiota bacterium]
METITLGTSSLTGSRLAYGCWRVTGPVESADLDPDHEQAAIRSITAAYEAGYTIFDHADIYANGESERVFGKVLKQISGMRDNVLVASKCGIRKAGDPDATSPYRYDFSEGHIIWSCEQSLKRMGVETLDLYMLHRPDYLSDPNEVAEAFSRLQQAGKVREFGVSNFSPIQLTTLQQACSRPLVANQIEISLAQPNALNNGTLDQCVISKITPMAWSPLGGGRLGSNDPVDLRDPDHAHRLQIRETLDLIAREHNTTRTVIAVAWLLKHPARIVPVIGSTSPEHIRELAGSVDIHLSRDDWYRLMEAGVGQRLP